MRLHQTDGIPRPPLRTRFALKIDGELLPTGFNLCFFVCSPVASSPLRETLPAHLYAPVALQVANSSPPVSAACHSSQIAAADRRASPTGRRTTRPPSRLSLHRLREFVRKCRDSCATYACHTRSDPGPCRCPANPPR